MMGTAFVLVPYDNVRSRHDYPRRTLEPYRLNGEIRDLRCDCYAVRPEIPFDDPRAAGRLPPALREDYAGAICDIENLPRDPVPPSLVTLSGEWFDLEDFGWGYLKGDSEENQVALRRWKAQYRELIAEARLCCVVSLLVHS